MSSDSAYSSPVYKRVLLKLSGEALMGDQPADKTEQPPAPKKKPLLDKNGREYRVCDMCGGNMYKQDNTWTCEQCGYSYEE